MYKILKNKKGFSLMEMIVVIFIITLGLVGVLSLVVQNMQVEYVNKNMLVASQLAQEGLALVRNMRDNNWLAAGADWETGDPSFPELTDIVRDGNYAIDYLVDSEGTIDIDSINDSEAVLYIDDDGFYRHYVSPPADATSTEFSRIVIVDSNTSNASTSAQCLVQWKRNTNTYQYVAETVFYDWR